MKLLFALGEFCRAPLNKTIDIANCADRLISRMNSCRGSTQFVGEISKSAQLASHGFHEPLECTGAWLNGENDHTLVIPILGLNQEVP